MKPHLTKPQSRVLAYIKSQRSRGRVPPSIADICEKFGWTSPNAAFSVLRALEVKCYIRREPRRARAITIVERSMSRMQREKGKAGERAAAKYLQGLGFTSARRTQQYNGDGKSDVVADELPHVHIEVKYGYASGFDIGSSVWQDACDQAYRDSGEHPNWCVLWRKKGSTIWKLSLFSFALNCIVTVSGDAAITNSLRRLNLEGPKMDRERLKGANDELD